MFYSVSRLENEQTSRIKTARAPYKLYRIFVELPSFSFLWLIFAFYFYDFARAHKYRLNKRYCWLITVVLLWWICIFFFQPKQISTVIFQCTYLYIYFLRSSPFYSQTQHTRIWNKNKTLYALYKIQVDIKFYE